MSSARSAGSPLEVRGSPVALVTQQGRMRLGVRRTSHRIAESGRRRLDNGCPGPGATGRSQEIAKLAFQLRHYQLSRQGERDRGIGERFELAQLALGAGRRRCDRADQVAAEGGPVDADVPRHAQVERLRRDLGVAVQDDLADLDDREAHVGQLAAADDELVTRPGDLRAALHDMEHLPVWMLGEQPDGLLPVAIVEPRLLGQANRRE
jgi:hypothetical protein